MTDPQTRVIAFYLPQYHPIPENDEWWGKGFTEWSKVVRARPLFPGHNQPQLPADLGFYDLRLPEARQAQADLARCYGVDGFCYYHYWFNGRRLLERPFGEVLASGQPDFPFCLCWANESWTRTWDGRTGETLIQQAYSDEDDRAHAHWLAECFRDPRYIRVDGRPLFLVYRATSLPNPAQTAAVWREEARRLGAGELYLGRVESFPDEHGDPTALGFDAAVQFHPDWTQLGYPLRRGRRWRLARRLGLDSASYGQHRIYDYVEYSSRMARLPPPSYKRFPGVMPAWDNSARRSVDAVIFRDATPENYQVWLKAVAQRLETQGLDDNLIFINAWNEWGEGDHLEPCAQWGRGYLEATRAALGKPQASST